jgi:hypothetical protein
MATVPPRVSAQPDLLDRLSATAHQLNTASDRLNAALEVVQKRLVEMGIGLEAWVSMETTRNWLPDDMAAGNREWYEHQLGYGRIGDSWGLLTRYSHFLDDDEDGEQWDHKDQKPLLRAARDVRLESVKALPRLVAELEAHANRILDYVEEAHRYAFGHRQQKMPGNGEVLTVPCQVSERFLKFAPSSSLLGGGEFLSMDVMTAVSVDSSRDGTRKICHLFVTREDLTRALRCIVPSPEPPVNDEPNEVQE